MTFKTQRTVSRFVVAAFVLLSFVFLAGAAVAADGHVITDQLGRTVRIPPKVERVVCLQHHTLNIILELGRGDKLVGVVEKWQGLLGDYIAKVYPRLKTLPTPGGLNEINVEAIASLRPDVVFVAHQLPKPFIEKLEKLGIPIVILSFYIADREQASTIHPDLVDPEAAYAQGLPQAIRLIAQVVDAEKRGEELIAFINESRTLVQKTLKGISPKDHVRVYMANPDMYTYGTGKYTGVAMNRAGAHNVAEAVKGYKQVNIEQIVKWDPEVIFVQNRYASVLDQIKKDPAWRGISAVKKGRLLIAPEYTKPWGHPCPESMALGELWLAKQFYPKRFAKIDVDAIVQKFYKKFYGVDYKSTL